VSLHLLVLSLHLAVCRLSPTDALPNWAMQSPFWSITRTLDEISIVVMEESVPEGITAERGWSAIKVQGPLDFSLTGILASLTTPLADAGISIFAISTYDTDYLLVRSKTVAEAIAVLERTGYTISNEKENR